jgi:hypothetical protein
VSLRVPPLLLAVPLLGIARLLPETGFGLWLRLAAATLIVLAPGRLVARALGRRGAAAALSWSCGIVAGALAITFAVHGSLNLTLGIVLGSGAAALVYGLRRRPRVEDDSEYLARGRGIAVLAGLVLGGGLWGIEGLLRGDGIFHLGRVRKLEDFGSLSLRAVDEFKNGGLHPGYAFPLWHGWLALVAKVAGVDPTQVMLHEPSILAPIAVVLAYEMGRAVFRSAPLGFAVAAAQVALIALAPGSGGAYSSLELPGTMSRQLLVPACITLFFRLVRRPDWPIVATLAVAAMDLSFIHPTYALFVAIPLAGYAVARLLVTFEDWRHSVVGLVAFSGPVLLVFAWLAPIVSETKAHNPSTKALRAGLAHYRTDLDVHSLMSYTLSPGVVARAGSIVVAGLVLTPLAGLAGRRRWSSFVLGGMLAVLGVELWSLVFPHFSDLVSLSQSRRAAGFVPFTIALAGGAAVVTRFTRWLVLPLALAAGIVLEHEFPGDFGLRLEHGGPSAAAWVALWGGLGALAVAVVVARVKPLPALERPGSLAALAVLLFVAPVAWHGATNWEARATHNTDGLTPGLVRFLREDVPRRSVVFADLETSYRISGYVPVYVAVAPPTHVADTRANDPVKRRLDFVRYLDTGSLAIPRKYGAQWLVLRGHEPIAAAERQGATVVYRDRRFVVLRL